MTWSLAGEDVAGFRRDGYLLLERVLDTNDLRLLDIAVSEVIETALSSERPTDLIEFEPSTKSGTRRVRRILNPYERHEAFRATAHDPRIVDRVESLFGSDLDLQHSKLNMKPAQIGSPVKWHQDLAYYPHTNDNVLAVLIYIDDANKANGCVQVLPRLHHSYLNHIRPTGDFAGRIVERISAEPRQLAAPAGSMIFLHGLTPHSSLPNLSSRDRRTLIFAYRAGDAYPLFYGAVTAEDEAIRRPIRGRRALHARFGGPPPIVPEINGTSSLYDIQADLPQACTPT